MIALILAAGQGRRMGGPKALLPWDGETLLSAHVRAAVRAGCSHAVAVLRGDVAERMALPSGGSVVVSHEDDALGPAGSIAAFVRSADFDARENVAVSPVDCLPAAWEALPALARELESTDALAARPVHAGRRGHPVVVRGTVLQAYASRATPLRDVLHALGPALHDVAVDVEAVLADLDQPSDLAR